MKKINFDIIVFLLVLVGNFFIYSVVGLNITFLDWIKITIGELLIAVAVPVSFYYKFRKWL